MSYVGQVKKGSTTHLVGSTLYGTCSTAAGTVAKVGTLANFDQLITGVTVHLKFTNSNTAANPTLNINGTGAKPIVRYGTTAVGNTATTSWYAGSIVSLTYDGTSWVLNDYKQDANTTYSAGTGLSLSGTQFSVDATYLINQIHPVGDTVIRTDNTNPGTLYPGTTWQKISEGKVLIGANSTYTLGSSANGSMKHSHTNPTTGGSSAANTGGTTLTAAQSGLRSHNHTQEPHSHDAGTYSDETKADFVKCHKNIDIVAGSAKKTYGSTDSGGKYWVYIDYDSGTTGGITEYEFTGETTAVNNSVADENATQAHTHTMAHTHTQGNTGEATIPYLAVNIWLRTA